MPEWIDVVNTQALETLARLGRTLVSLDGCQIAVFRQDGALFAMENSCPHQGASLCSGKIDNGHVKCPAHGMRFRLSDGLLAGSSCEVGAAALGVKVFEIRQIGENLQIRR